MPIFLLMNLSDVERSVVEALYEAHGAELLRFAYSFLENAFLAEEVVQDAFLALIREPKRMQRRSEKELRAYLFSKTRYYALEALRSRKKENEKVDRFAERFADETAEDRESLAAIGDIAIGPNVDEIVEGLSETSQEVLWLKYAKALTNKEIATHLNISYNAVCTRLSRAYKEFREAISDRKETTDDRW